MNLPDVSVFTFHGLLKSVRLSLLRSSDRDGYELSASIEVPHVDTGEEIRVYMFSQFPTEALDSPGFLTAAVADLVDDLLRHERDEGLRLNGKPLRDPHPPTWHAVIKVD